MTPRSTSVIMPFHFSEVLLLPMPPNSIFKYVHSLISEYGFSYKRGDEGESLFYPATGTAHCDPQTFSTFPAPSRDVGSRSRGCWEPSPSVSSRLVSRDGLVSRQPSSGSDRYAYHPVSHPTPPTFSREKQCTYSADSLQPPPTTAADVFSPSPLPIAPAPRHQALAL